MLPPPHVASYQSASEITLGLIGHWIIQSKKHKDSNYMENIGGNGITACLLSEEGSSFVAGHSVLQ